MADALVFSAQQELPDEVTSLYADQARLMAMLAAGAVSKAADDSSAASRSGRAPREQRRAGRLVRQADSCATPSSPPAFLARPDCPLVGLARAFDAMYPALRPALCAWLESEQRRFEAHAAGVTEPLNSSNLNFRCPSANPDDERAPDLDDYDLAVHLELLMPSDENASTECNQFTHSVIRIVAANVWTEHDAIANERRLAFLAFLSTLLYDGRVFNLRVDNMQHPSLAASAPEQYTEYKLLARAIRDLIAMLPAKRDLTTCWRATRWGYQRLAPATAALVHLY